MPASRADEAGAPPRLHHPRADGPCARPDGPARLGGQRADHARPPLSQDTRFLARDRGERPAQVHLVVEVDADDGGGDGLHDVGRVEPPAEARLEDGHVHALAAEVREGGGRRHLEEGRVRLEDPAADEPLGRVADGAHRDREVVVGDLAPVDGDPLVHAHEVGRGVAAGAQARRPQRGVAVGRDRALAVRAGDEQRRVRALGVAHLGDERPHRLEPELHPEPHPSGEVETSDPVGGQWGHGPMSLSEEGSGREA